MRRRQPSVLFVKASQLGEWCEFLRQIGSGNGEPKQSKSVLFVCSTTDSSNRPRNYRLLTESYRHKRIRYTSAMTWNSYATLSNEALADLNFEFLGLRSRASHRAASYREPPASE